MICDQPFLTIDSTGWTAIASITALTLGLYGILGPLIYRFFTRPKLRIYYDRIGRHSSHIGDRIHVRIPIYNEKCRSAAEQVEVFLEDIKQLPTSHSFLDLTFLPIASQMEPYRHSPICDRISGGAFRLLDLGQLQYVLNKPSRFLFVMEAQPIEQLSLTVG